MGTMAGYDRSPNRTGTCPSCGGPSFGRVRCAECGSFFEKITFAQKTCGKECSRLRMNHNRRKNDAIKRAIAILEK